LYAVAFVMIIIVVMIAAGYYLFRSWLRDYTNDAPPKHKYIKF